MAFASWEWLLVRTLPVCALERSSLSIASRIKTRNAKQIQQCKSQESLVLQNKTRVKTNKQRGSVGETSCDVNFRSAACLADHLVFTKKSYAWLKKSASISDGFVWLLTTDWLE